MALISKLDLTYTNDFIGLYIVWDCQIQYLPWILYNLLWVSNEILATLQSMKTTNVTPYVIK